MMPSFYSVAKKTVSNAIDTTLSPIEYHSNARRVSNDTYFMRMWIGIFGNLSGKFSTISTKRAKNEGIRKKMKEREGERVKERVRAIASHSIWC